MSRIFHRRACQNICSLLVPCHLMARGLKNGNNSFEDDPKAFKQTFQFIIFYFVFSFIASRFPFIQMAMFKDCGCQKHQQCPLPSAALLCLCRIQFNKTRKIPLGSPGVVCHQIFFRNIVEEKTRCQVYRFSSGGAPCDPS